LAYKFNVITGKLDLVDSGGSQSPNYQVVFNNTTDWGSPSGGYYSLNVLAASHGKGLNPVIQVYELVGSDYELITAAVSIDSSTGDVTIGVVETPDSRFEGKLILSENN